MWNLPILEMIFRARQMAQQIRHSLCLRIWVQILRTLGQPGVVMCTFIPSAVTERWEAGGFPEVLGPASLAQEMGNHKTSCVSNKIEAETNTKLSSGLQTHAVAGTYLYSPIPHIHTHMNCECFFFSFLFTIALPVQCFYQATYLLINFWQH